MKYYSKEDLRQMKEWGYEKFTIDKARKIQEVADPLIIKIEQAFEGVELENGIGLFEAQIIDGYYDCSN